MKLIYKIFLIFLSLYQTYPFKGLLVAGLKKFLGKINERNLHSHVLYKIWENILEIHPTKYSYLPYEIVTFPWKKNSFSCENIKLLLSLTTITHCRLLFATTR